MGSMSGHAAAPDQAANPFGPLCPMRLANTAMLQEIRRKSYKEHEAQQMERWAVL